jgi:transcriptional regulator of acetoin/glycerol metabolism
VAPAAAPAIAVHLPYKEAKRLWTEHFEAVYLPLLLERCEGNVSRAAREAQLDRAYLFRMLSRLGLRGRAPGQGR